MSRQTVAMDILQRTPAAEQAVQDLAGALPGAELTPPDETGIFEVTVEADDFEGALEQIWNGVAAAGADDHVVFAEHPDIPEHWRDRTAGAG
jgi:hypothetical protein